jgi:3-deoxy-D-manno-octulosonate 8-phosphate phosphatase (KDO 8-P phosphatase)
LIPTALSYCLRRRLLNPKLRGIRLVVCDVDGVLTDGGLSCDEEGKVLLRFDVRAGLAVCMLQQAGITVALLSGGRGGASEQRALHLDIRHCRVGVGDKRARGSKSCATSWRRQADWILRRRGGDGALREFSDALLASQGWMEGFETSGVGTTN